MTLFVQRPGIMDTVQDLGRFGYLKYGINPGGAMDRTAVRLLNALLENDDDVAVIECHFPAAEFRFDEDAVCAVGGAEFTAELDERSVENWRPFAAPKGSVLRFRQPAFGQRAYLAVSGGLKLPEWLGSKSTNLSAGRGGLEGRKLRAGDIIESGGPSSMVARPARISHSLIPFYSRFPTVRVIEGPEFDRLDAASRQDLFSINFKVTSRSDRMGYRLSGKALGLTGDREYISGGVTFGTVQLLPDGQLIVLMADHQTTGGYPRIASIAEVDLPLMAQLGPNDKVGFHPIPLGEAERLSASFERDLKRLRTGAAFMK